MVDWGSVDATPRIDAAGWYLMDITAESGNNSSGKYLQLNMACAEGSFNVRVVSTENIWPKRRRKAVKSLVR